MSSNERKMIDNALKIGVVPFLRENGFKGSFPHFRRKTETNIELVTFQFNRWGGSFVVELATCPLEGVTTSWGELIPPNKVTAHDVNQRFRLGARSKGAEGKWFTFENANSDKEYEKIATSVVDLLHISDTSWISSLLN
ncbi:DUF4304 domain-containing protein [Fredinandcohnia sp. 179-A 10B2 NHS]|uniref:DUF4304 domain-containing protein n=1 Tax=Fredinandcohnia sp. 179-A 10B2 NHS TaxID=3235176 RepID=UPI0039A35D8B